MVVCKCRKATRIYCFVHKTPVCGECICFPEHQICVVKKYSDWVIDAEYDWPPKCSGCSSILEDKADETTRLGCLHVMHTKCFISHIQSFSAQTTSAGFVCPSCSTPIWPPLSIKDTGSCLHSKLKEAIIQTSLEKNVFGNHLVTAPKSDVRAPPPAFATDPLIQFTPADRESNGAAQIIIDPSLPSSIARDEKYSSQTYSSTERVEPEIVEVDGPNLSGSHQIPGATARKVTNHVERQNSEISYYADDEDGNSKKYAKRGNLRHKLMRMLLPFWSSALPTLPVTAPVRKDSASEAPEGRTRHQKSSGMDPRKILLMLAIMACMATMGILYYRLAQRSLAENIVEDELQ